MKQFEIGIYDAVSNFNIGNMASIRTFEKLGMKVGDNMQKGCVVSDNSRISNSKRQSTDKKKDRRRYHRGLKKQKIDKCKVGEGKTWSWCILGVLVYY